MGIEKVANLLGGRTRQTCGFGLHLAELFQRDRDGLCEALLFGLDLPLRDVVLRHWKIAALDDVSLAYGNSRGYGETRKSLFAGLGHRAGDLLNPRQTCIRRVW